MGLRLESELIDLYISEEAEMAHHMPQNIEGRDISAPKSIWFSVLLLFSHSALFIKKENA